MKIRCSNCKAVISVADEKLSGKSGRVKVRCPECQTVLGIKLDDGEKPAQEEAEWYYAVGEEQHGPVTRTELVSLVVGGSVSGESLVWKPGMDNWQEAGKVEELQEIPEPTLELPPAAEGVAAEEPAAEAVAPSKEPDEDVAFEQLMEQTREELQLSDEAEEAPLAQEPDEISQPVDEINLSDSVDEDGFVALHEDEASGERVDAASDAAALLEEEPVAEEEEPVAEEEEPVAEEEDPVAEEEEPVAEEEDPVAEEEEPVAEEEEPVAEEEEPVAEEEEPVAEEEEPVAEEEDPVAEEEEPVSHEEEPVVEEDDVLPVAADEEDEDVGGGLFADFGGDEEESGSEASGEMLHSRRENSVLFSLDDLSKKADDRNASTASGDDSGLIDIRQVAVTGSGDDLFSGFGAGDGSAADVSAEVPMAGAGQATLAMPILRRKSRWPAYLAASVVGAVLIAGAVYVAMTMATGPGESGIRQAVASASEMAFTQINQARIKMETEHQATVAQARTGGKEQEMVAEREAEAELASFEKVLEARLADVETLHSKEVGDLEAKLAQATKEAEERKQRRLAAELALKQAALAKVEAPAESEKVAEVASADGGKSSQEKRVAKKETAEERQARKEREAKRAEERAAKKEEKKEAEKEVVKKEEKKEVAKVDDGKKDPAALLKALDKKSSDTGSADSGDSAPKKKMLTTTDIMKVVNGNKSAMRACFEKYGAGLESATIRTQLKISGSGEVTNVSISSMEYAGTALGNCVRKAQSRMSFPAFAKPSLTKSISVRLP
jgi:predicted Zn finger-like uncharacterized protein